jgi:hypothetical protein
MGHDEHGAAEARLAKKDWKKAVQDAYDALGDRIRDAIEALDALVGPQPVPVPVPVRPVRPDQGPRRR